MVGTFAAYGRIYLNKFSLASTMYVVAMKVNIYVDLLNGCGMIILYFLLRCSPIILESCTTILRKAIMVLFILAGHASTG